jgi:hypothetical protein
VGIRTRARCNPKGLPDCGNSRTAPTHAQPQPALRFDLETTFGSRIVRSNHAYGDSVIGNSDGQFMRANKHPS